MTTGKEKLLGTVKWFNNQKGYGFICATEKTNSDQVRQGEDIFAHFSSIVMDGYKSLKAGQLVTFELNQGPKGLHAINITPADNTEKQFFGYTTANHVHQHIQQAISPNVMHPGANVMGNVAYNQNIPAFNVLEGNQ